MEVGDDVIRVQGGEQTKDQWEFRGRGSKEAWYKVSWVSKEPKEDKSEQAFVQPRNCVLMTCVKERHSLICARTV